MKHPPPPPRLKRKRLKPPPRRQPRRPAPERGHPPPAVQVAWERRSKQAHLQRLAYAQIQNREMEEMMWRLEQSAASTCTYPPVFANRITTGDGEIRIVISYGDGRTGE